MPRDKFAAIASRATEGGDSSSQQNVASDTTSSAGQLPRRDKFSSLAESNAKKAGGGNNKFAAMAAANASGTSPREMQPHQGTDKATREESLTSLKERMSRRGKIFENLDRAEDLTCKLLEIVHQTTTALQDLSGESSRKLNQLSREYRSTLQEIHPLLSQDTETLVKAYQNHSTETKQSMYAARVEMRLAKERTDVLKAFTELEKRQKPGPVEGKSRVVNKRKRPRS